MPNARIFSGIDGFCIAREFFDADRHGQIRDVFLPVVTEDNPTAEHSDRHARGNVDLRMRLATRRAWNRFRVFRAFGPKTARGMSNGQIGVPDRVRNLDDAGELKVHAITRHRPLELH